jgi:hypothetical protein
MIRKDLKKYCVPRHHEINEYTAKAILREAGGDQP